jgi:hypothetical protein
LNIKEVQPKALFDAAHVEAWSPQLAAYFPLGCALAAVRFAAWIAGQCALKESLHNNLPVGIVSSYLCINVM